MDRVVAAHRRAMVTFLTGLIEALDAAPQNAARDQMLADLLRVREMFATARTLDQLTVANLKTQAIFPPRKGRRYLH